MLPLSIFLSGTGCGRRLNLKLPRVRLQVLEEDRTALKFIECSTYSVSAHSIYSPGIIHKRYDEA